MDIIDDIFDLMWMSSQNRKVADLRREVDRLKESARSAAGADPGRAEPEQLRAAVGELRLCVAVLFRVLVTKGVIGRDDLAKLVEQVDDEDGRRDKSHAGPVLP
ncbi:MAG TPA: hypothetical protein VGF55_03225 [Gemmataceae bacterium]|jgi:hypothetical protein